MFLGKETAFLRDAPGIATESAVGVDDAVTGDATRPWIALQRLTDRPRQVRVAELPGHPLIRTDLTFRNPLDDGIDPPLERRDSISLSRVHWTNGPNINFQSPNKLQLPMTE